jgi:quinol monooxygenase YgiN
VEIELGMLIQKGNRHMFVILEEWKDQGATEFHRETAHYKKFIEGVKPILLEPPHVKRYTVIEQL